MSSGEGAPVCAVPVCRPEQDPAERVSGLVPACASDPSACSALCSLSFSNSPAHEAVSPQSSRWGAAYIRACLLGVPGTRERSLYPRVLNKQANKAGHTVCVTERREVASAFPPGDPCGSIRPFVCSIRSHAKNGYLPSGAETDARAVRPVAEGRNTFTYLLPSSLLSFFFPPLRSRGVYQPHF